MGVQGVNKTSYQFNGIQDNITVPHSNQFNFHAMSISSWIQPYNDEETGYAGEIKHILSEKSESKLFEPDVVHVKDHTYVLAYRDNEYKGYVDMVRIDKSGENFEIIQPGNFICDNVLWPDIIQVNGEIMAIVWGSTSGSNLFVTTIRINAVDGSVEVIQEESLHFGWSFGYKPCIKTLKSTSNYKLFAISGGGGIDQGGGVALLRINNDGSFNSPSVSFPFNMMECSAADIIFIYGGCFAVVYSGLQEEYIAVIQPFRFDDDFLMSLLPFIFSIPHVSEPSIVKSQTENRYVISFSNNAYGGFLTAFTMNQYGHFPPQQNPPSLFSVGYPSLCSIIKYLGNSIYTIAYSSGCEYFKSSVLTVKLQDTNIAHAKIIDHYYFEYPVAYCDIVEIQESDVLRFAIIGGSVDKCEPYEGFFTSVLIFNTTKTKGFFIKQDAYELRMTDSKVFVFLNGQELLSGPLKRNLWNFVTFTYKFDKADIESCNIFLYVDGELVDSGLYNQIINNNNELVLGGFRGLLDEVILFRDSLSSQQVRQLYQKYI